MSKTNNIYSAIRSAKFVLKPNSKQKEILKSFFNLNRALYNIALYETKNNYFGTYEIQNGKNKGQVVSKIPTEFDLNKMLPKLKEEYEFLKLFPSSYAQAVMKNLSRGFDNFYRTFNYPKFKAKKSNMQSFNMYASSLIKMDSDHIILQKPRGSDYTKEDLRIRFKRHKIKYSFNKVNGFYYKQKRQQILYFFYFLLWHRI